MNENKFDVLIDDLIELCFEINSGNYYCDRVLEFDDVLELLERKLMDNDWISCSNALPEDILTYNQKVSSPKIDVLVTTKHGKVTKLQRIGEKGYDGKHELSWHWGRIYSDVIAWQPLPERYRGE